MKPEDRMFLHDLLQHSPAAVLAVQVDGGPYAGLVPFAALTDYTAMVIHVSNLAIHSQGLSAGSPFSLLIHAPLSPDQDPLQIPRVTLNGQAWLLGRDEGGYIDARQTYQAKYPASEMLFGFKDFNLYRLDVGKGRFVAAFGRAYNLTQATLQGLREKGNP